MIIRVNNDVILGLTTGHWSRQAWPQYDIIIDPTYHRHLSSLQLSFHSSTKWHHILYNSPTLDIVKHNIYMYMNAY